MITTSGWYVISQRKDSRADKVNLNVHSRPFRSELAAQTWLNSIRHEMSKKREYFIANFKT